MTVQLFIGLPKTGKTQAMLDLISLNCHNAGEGNKHLFFVVDRAAEFGIEDPDNPGNPNPRWRGTPPKNMFLAPPPEEFDAWLSSDEFPLDGVVLFRYPWEGMMVAEKAVAIGNIVYVDDEIDMVATYKYWVEGAALREIVHRGRHLPNAEGVNTRMHIMGAMRRPQNVHTDLTSMCDEVLLFRIGGSRTIERVLKENYVAEDKEEEITKIPDLHYFVWRNTGEMGRGRLVNAYPEKSELAANSGQATPTSVSSLGMDNQTTEGKSNE